MAKHKKKQFEYQGGKIKRLVEVVAALVAAEPTLASDHDRLHATVKTHFEGYGQREKCFNCARSMRITEHTADLHDGLLLLGMAQMVAINTKKGMTFTEANKIHVPSLPTTDAVRHRTTKASYLNLVKQPDGIKNSGYWVITNWGWKVLRGEPIPKSVKYWEGKLVGRSEDTTTLTEMFNTHVDLVKRALSQRFKVRSDYREKVAEYSPSEWVDYVESVTAPQLF